MVVGLALNDICGAGVAAGGGTGVGCGAGVGAGTMTGGGGAAMIGTSSASVAITKSADTQPLPPGAEGTATTHQLAIGAATDDFAFGAKGGNAKHRKVGTRAGANVDAVGRNHAGGRCGRRRRWHDQGLFTDHVDGNGVSVVAHFQEVAVDGVGRGALQGGKERVSCSMTPAGDVQKRRVAPILPIEMVPSTV